MAAPGSHTNKNSTQINKRRMTKQHSSSMYVGLLSTSALPFFFSLLSLSRSKSLKLLVSLLAGQSVHPRESTISMQLGSVVYKKIKSNQSTGSENLQSRPGPRYFWPGFHCFYLVWCRMGIPVGCLCFHQQNCLLWGMQNGCRRVTCQVEKELLFEVAHPHPMIHLLFFFFLIWAKNINPALKLRRQVRDSPVMCSHS